MTHPIFRYLDIIEQTDPIPVHGRVSQAIGLVVEGYVPISTLGEMCEITPVGSGKPVPAEVVGFREDKVLLMPLGEVTGIGPGSSIVRIGTGAAAAVGESLLGRVIDGLGNPLDGKGPLKALAFRPLYIPPPNPMERRRIAQPLDLGVRAVNGFLTCGKGQRAGIFAGSGVGKSVLLGMIARYTAADVNVIALIGERGREAKEFIEKHLQDEGLRRSVVVVATSDQPPLVRRRAAFLSIAIAEYFRDRDLNVILMMDSLTRLAYAQREIGLATGEPPATKGYTPSVFALLPKFLERAGTSAGHGAITGLFTVLVEGDDLNDPVSDAVRAILDGHIVLSRELAAHNHFPAIDILNSTSRVMVDVVGPEQWENARRLRDLMAAYKKAEDLIHIGAYKAGSDAKTDRAIAKRDEIQAFLRQEMNERCDLREGVAALKRLAAGAP